MTGAPRAYVIGGGVAGMTAAFGLAVRGYRVDLLEARRVCGGRAFSFVDRGTGQRLDNGPHVLLGCYRAMRGLLRQLGTEELFAVGASLQLAFRTAEGQADWLALGGLPVPLAMPLGLFSLGVPLRARWRALCGMVAVLRGAPPQQTLGEWLAARRQLGLPDAWLWRPLCRAIMNVEPEACAAADFLVTLREAFTGRASAAAFWLPKRPWGEILADAAPARLARAGVTLRTGTPVIGLGHRGGRVATLQLGGGEGIELNSRDLVVSAVPWFALRRLLPEAPDGCGELAASPIVTAHFRLPEAGPPLPDDGPVVALVDGDPFHFVLRTPGGDGRSFAMLSGGNRSFDGQPVAAIAARAIAQLGRHYPGVAFGGAAVRISKEQLATFVASPGSGARRPPPGPLPGGPTNLLVCGDWTATGLPATLEGAARSAEALLRRLGE